MPAAGSTPAICFKTVEGATPDQLNQLFNGARIVDGKPQSDGLTDGKRELSLNINRETNRGRLDGLLEKKVAYGVELGQIADKIKDTPLGKPLDPKTLQELRRQSSCLQGHGAREDAAGCGRLQNRPSH